MVFMFINVLKAFEAVKYLIKVNVGNNDEKENGKRATEKT
jgi:hypothetical protein